MNLPSKLLDMELTRLWKKGRNDEDTVCKESGGNRIEIFCAD